jgi:hypothetical protein
MLVRTLACARTGRSAGTVMVANRSLGNPTDRDDNGGLRNRLCYGAIGPYRACAPQFYPNKDVIRCLRDFCGSQLCSVVLRPALG